MKKIGNTLAVYAGLSLLVNSALAQDDSVDYSADALQQMIQLCSDSAAGLPAEDARQYIENCEQDARANSQVEEMSINELAVPDTESEDVVESTDEQYQ